MISIVRIFCIVTIYILASICSINAQDWKKMQADELKLNTIQDNIRYDFNGRSYSKRIDRKNYSRAYKQFKRWEYYWENRVLSTGVFQNPMHTYNEYIKYKTNQYRSTTSENWISLGPSTIPESTSSFYAGLGRINVVEFNPSNSNIIWIGTPAGGLWKSTDAGSTWVSKGNNVPNLGVSDIAIDANNTDIMYIATGDYDGQHNNSLGVFKSVDGGETWSVTGLNYDVTNSRQVAHVIIDPSNSNNIFATTSNGIYKSTNKGSTWTLKSTVKFFNDILYKPGSTTIMYASSQSGDVYKSTDNGETWQDITGDSFETNRIDIAVTAHDPEIIVAIGSSNGYKSTDGGTTWNDMTIPAQFDTQGGYNQTIIIAPDNKDLMILGGVDGWRSKIVSNNLTWEKYMDGYWETGSPFFYVHSDHHDLKFLPGSNKILFSANDGGLFKGDITQDSNWEDLSNGLAITQYYKLAVTPKNSNLVMGGAQDNDITQFDGTKWHNRNYGSDGVETVWDYSDEKIAYTCSQSGFMKRTLDGWATASTVINTPSGAAFVWPLEIHPTNPATLFGGFSNIYKSTDKGDNWQSLASPTNGSIKVIAISPSDTKYIYCSSGFELFGTKDDGKTWSTITKPASGNITSIAVNAVRPEEFYVTFGGYNDGSKVYKSIDFGATWTNITGSLPNIPVNKIVYETGSDNELYIGTDLGVYYKDGNSSGWVPFNNGLPNVIVNDLEILYAAGKLRAATFGRGIWETAIAADSNGDFKPGDGDNGDGDNGGGTDAINNSNKIIFNIYPSPTDGLFNINIPENSTEYSLIVYNSVGGVVYTDIMNGTQKTVDISEYVNGVYIVSLSDGENRSVRKIVKTKL
jgi:photosystem II stability/assembly factor-like uncharacterized protein